MSTPYQDTTQPTNYYTATPTPSAPSPHPQSTPDLTQPGPSTSQPSRPVTGQAAEETRKDKTLAEFLLMLDDYEPLVRVIMSRICGGEVASMVSVLTITTADSKRSHGVLPAASRV